MGTTPNGLTSPQPIMGGEKATLTAAPIGTPPPGDIPTWKKDVTGHILVPAANGLSAEFEAVTGGLLGATGPVHITVTDGVNPSASATFEYDVSAPGVTGFTLTSNTPQ